jgi:ribosomal-protein-alanine N-acetyltransferase
MCLNFNLPHVKNDYIFKQVILKILPKSMLTVNFDPFPFLTTPRLSLRKISLADEDAIYALRSDPRVMEYLDRPRASSVKDARELIEKINTALNNNDGITWGICLKGEQELIGTIGFWRMMKEHYRAEIGYMLHPDYQGKGLMQEAMTTVIDYGFANMKLHSIEANVNPANEASLKVMAKNKFVQEAWFKENYFYNGRFLDSVIYSLLTPYK